MGNWYNSFELYKTKRVSYCDLFDWSADWLQHRDNPNVMLVIYEDMQHRMPDVINRLCEFLGKDLPEDVISDMVQYLTFDSVSRNDMTNLKHCLGIHTSISTFVRKGIFGDLLFSLFFSINDTKFALKLWALL